MATICVLGALGAPGFAQTDSVTDAETNTVTGSLTEAWQDLRDRCADAVLSGEMLNVAGLDARLPDFFFDVVEDDLFFGPRIELSFTAPGRRTVPTGVWGTPPAPDSARSARCVARLARLSLLRTSRRCARRFKRSTQPSSRFHAKG